MDEDKVERLRERFLQCSVCMDEFQDPRLLPCHHTICFDCIQRLLMSSMTGRSFRCPQCRRDVCLPRGGAAELPVNFYIRSLQEELGEETLAGPCQVCSRSNMAAQFRCIDCDLDICRFCIHEHRLVQHKDCAVVNILRMEVAGALIGGPTSNRSCSTHVEETVQLFCDTCQQPVCVRCSCGEHRKHKLQSLGEKLHGSREHLQQELDALTRERRQVKGWIRQLEAAEIEVKDNGSRTLALVHRRARDLHALVDRLADNVMDKVRYREQQQLTDISTCKLRLSKLSQRLDIGTGFLRGLQEGDVSLELLDSYKTFSSELDEVRNNATANTVVPLCDQKFLLGRHTEFKGLFLGTFGALKARRSYLHFGSGKLPLLWRVCRKLTLGNVLRWLTLTFLLFAVVKLSVLIYVTPSDHVTYSETVAALCVMVYLLLTAVFAFRKSKLESCYTT